MSTNSTLCTVKPMLWSDMLAADAQDEAETDDMKRARLRYQRQFWEAVPEDQVARTLKARVVFTNQCRS